MDVITEQNVFLDELVNGVQLGGTYTVVGVPATVGLGQDSSFCVEASNIIPFKSQGITHRVITGYYSFCT